MKTRIISKYMPYSKWNMVGRNTEKGKVISRIRYNNILFELTEYEWEYLERRKLRIDEQIKLICEHLPREFRNILKEKPCHVYDAPTFRRTRAQLPQQQDAIDHLNEVINEFEERVKAVAVADDTATPETTSSDASVALETEVLKNTVIDQNKTIGKLETMIAEQSEMIKTMATRFDTLVQLGLDELAKDNDSVTPDTTTTTTTAEATASKSGKKDSKK